VLEETTADERAEAAADAAAAKRDRKVVFKVKVRTGDDKLAQLKDLVEDLFRRCGVWTFQRLRAIVDVFTDQHAPGDEDFINHLHGKFVEDDEIRQAVAALDTQRLTFYASETYISNTMSTGLRTGAAELTAADKSLVAVGAFVREQLLKLATSEDPRTTKKKLADLYRETHSKAELDKRHLDKAMTYFGAAVKPPASWRLRKGDSLTVEYLEPTDGGDGDSDGGDDGDGNDGDDDDDDDDAAASKSRGKAKATGKGKGQAKGQAKGKGKGKSKSKGKVKAEPSDMDIDAGPKIKQESS
jgi:hypothetical protein